MALRIDVISDMVCPWCFIGTRRLEQALASLGDLEAQVVYRPFLLDPSVPPGGVDLRERLRKKYRADPDTMFVRVEEAARDTGIPLDFSKVTRMVSTVAGHTLMRHALPKGTQRALADTLFEAYFLEGRDIGDPNTLAVLAEGHGFTADETARLLSDDAELARTREEAGVAARSGVEGVPFFVFGGRVGVSGAQPLSVLRSAIEKATQPTA